MQSKRTTLDCQQCGAEFEVRAYRVLDPSRGKFCGRACYWAHKRTVRRPLADRFWEKVDKNGPIPAHRPELGPCWLWTGALGPKGYGKINLGGRNDPEVPAPRAAWIVARGSIPADKHACHACDNPPCVRNGVDGLPSHLFLGSAAENMADKVLKWRQARGDMSGARTRPDRVPRGERHGSRTHPESVPRGEAHSAAKMTEAQAREILQRHAAGGISQKELAREYGLSRPTVCHLIRRVTWKHLV